MKYDVHTYHNIKPLLTIYSHTYWCYSKTFYAKQYVRVNDYRVWKTGQGFRINMGSVLVDSLFYALGFGLNTIT